MSYISSFMKSTLKTPQMRNIYWLSGDIADIVSAKSNYSISNLSEASKLANLGVPL